MGGKSTLQLHTLDSLFAEKEKELKQAIGSLQIREVKEDEAYIATVKRIKDSILLEPVKIGDPKITGNQQETREMRPNYQNLWGGTQSINVITVEFPFTGSRELFDYRASGGSLSVRNIYEPSYKTIQVDVQLGQLDKAMALSKATEEMATTFELIRQNNPDVERWSAAQEVIIGQMADKKRKELLDLYS